MYQSISVEAKVSVNGWVHVSLLNLPVIFMAPTNNYEYF